MAEYTIGLLDQSINTGAFQSGDATMDTYVRRYAARDARKRIERVFVATREGETRALGFFTLNGGSVACSELSAMQGWDFPYYPVPIACISRLAVDLACQGTGLGSILLVNACRRVLEASNVLPMAAVAANADSDQAMAFYQHFGFTPLPGQERRMLLPISTLQRFLTPSDNAA